MSEFTLPEGTAPEVVEAFAKPEFQAAIQAMIESTTSGLVTKRDELLAYKATTSKELEPFGGIEGVKAKMTALGETERAKAEAEQAALLASGNVDAIKASYQTQLEQTQAELKAERDSRVQETAARRIDRAMKESDVDAPELLEHVLKARTKTEVVDGKVVVKVLNASGAPMLTSDGKEATLKDLMTEFSSHPTYARAFKAQNVSGSGSRSGAVAPGGVDNPFARGTPSFNVTKQMEMFKSNPQLATILAAEHGIKL